MFNGVIIVIGIIEFLIGLSISLFAKSEGVWFQSYLDATTVLTVHSFITVISFQYVQDVQESLPE